ncbi:hypothetical protein DHEL01_v201112 [Diaporthe helianthi]|uniref:Uncharacterized protein n=1 Tax=Diaporthe helianthi TaxID=158607 RepID=A0A2P5ID83_DIAHE|nr:hypothetical protein DHEL01_v201112 [Diaporthe helianthi]
MLPSSRKDKGKQPANSSTGSPAHQAGGSDQGEQPSGAGTRANGGRGRRNERSLVASSRVSSVASGSAGPGRQTGSGMGKRLAGSVEEAMAQGLKRQKTVGFVMTPASEVSKEVDMWGRPARFEAKDKSKKGQPLVTPSTSQFGAMDIAFNTKDADGHAIVCNALKAIDQVGAEKALVTVQGIYSNTRENDVYRSSHQPPLDYDDIAHLVQDDTASVMSTATTSKVGNECLVCGNKKHPTKSCHKPSRDGTTVICPFHNTSARVGGHNLDGHDRKVGKGYCTVLMDFENSTVDPSSDEYKRRLGQLFDKLVQNRRRMPVVRVVKSMYCPINIAIEYSNAWHDGAMPPELKGAWPYTKNDLRNKDLVEKLNSRARHNWMKMPPGELEGMSWEHIKKEYGKSIPVQCVGGGVKAATDEDEVMDDAPPVGGAGPGMAAPDTAGPAEDDGASSGGKKGADEPNKKKAKGVSSALVSVARPTQKAVTTPMGSEPVKPTTKSTAAGNVSVGPLPTRSKQAQEQATVVGTGEGEEDVDMDSTEPGNPEGKKKEKDWLDSEVEFTHSDDEAALRLSSKND